MKELYEFLVNSRINKVYDEFPLYYIKEYNIPGNSGKRVFMLAKNKDELEYILENTDIPMNAWFKNPIEKSFDKFPDYYALLSINRMKNGEYEIIPWNYEYVPLKKARSEYGVTEMKRNISPDKLNPGFWKENNWLIYQI